MADAIMLSTRTPRSFGRQTKVAILGVMMLDTHFPRPPGDIGNASTFACEVRFEVVPAASAARVVRAGTPDPSLLAPFLEARDRLVAAGAGLVTTSCGFLAAFQPQLAAGCPVPVVASALLQLSSVDAALAAAGRRAGVLTVHAGRLGATHFAAVGARVDTPVAGIENGRHLAGVLLNDLPELDMQAAEADVVDAGRQLLAVHPEVGALVLECTNMPPYRAALAAAVGVPVHDLLTMIETQPGFGQAVAFGRAP